MYVGLVRGSGKKDQAGAREAFKKALETDPAVTLDVELATPETKETFQQLGGQVVAADPEGGGDTPGVDVPAVDGGPAPAAPAAAGLDCSPGVIGLQTRRAVPVACRGDGEATSMTLRYEEYGGEGWSTVEMT
jgi:hypothetical protein